MKVDKLPNKLHKKYRSNINKLLYLKCKKVGYEFQIFRKDSIYKCLFKNVVINKPFEYLNTYDDYYMVYSYIKNNIKGLNDS